MFPPPPPAYNWSPVILASTEIPIGYTICPFYRLIYLASVRVARSIDSSLDSSL